MRFEQHDFRTETTPDTPQLYADDTRPNHTQPGRY